MEQTATRTWTEEFGLVTYVLDFRTMLQCLGLIPSEGLSVDELQHIPGDIKLGLPLLLQHQLEEESGGRML